MGVKTVEKLVEKMVADNKFSYVSADETGRISFEYHGYTFEVGEGSRPEGGRGLFIVINNMEVYPSGAAIKSVYDSLRTQIINEYLSGLV